MKNFSKLFGIVALIAVIGFSMVSCDTGGGGGGGGLELVVGTSGTRVEFTMTGVTSASSVNRGDFVLTIDGTIVNIAYESTERIGTTVYELLYFTSPAITVGTRYNVKVEYIGSAVAPFTLQGTITARRS